MATSTDWNKANAAKTLEKLRKDYPRYTDNEVYAIWCVNNQAVPLDGSGKMDQKPWRVQAEEDGKYVQDGGFRVSRALYGRAMRAKKGVEKPKGKPRGRVAAAAGGGDGAGISRTAMEFARKYDEAGRAIEAIQRKRKEIEQLMEGLAGVSKAIAQDLAEADAGAKAILKEAKVI